MLKKGDKRDSQVRSFSSQSRKRGLSPVIATVLLVGLVVVSGLIIFVWFRGLTQEAVTKFDRNIQLVCKDVKFDASYSSSDDKLDLVNRASTPIYGFNAKKIFADGGYETIDIREEDDWPDNGLLGSAAITLGIDLGSATDVTLTPVLAGTTQNGEQTSFACDENLYGQPVSIL